jgi:hypothetical protein
MGLAKGKSIGSKDMKTKSLSLATLLLIAIVPAAANAGAFQYECEVKQVSDVEKGKATPRSRDIAIGEKFTISRQTGEIVGSKAYVLNRTQGWKEFRVLDSGGPGQSYKFIAVSSGPNTWVIFIHVKEYEEGPDKTFTLIDNSLLTVGTCK